MMREKDDFRDVSLRKARKEVIERLREGSDSVRVYADAGVYGSDVSVREYASRDRKVEGSFDGVWYIITEYRKGKEISCEFSFDTIEWKPVTHAAKLAYAELRLNNLLEKRDLKRGDRRTLFYKESYKIVVDRDSDIDYAFTFSIYDRITNFAAVNTELMCVGLIGDSKIIARSLPGAGRPDMLGSLRRGAEEEGRPLRRAEIAFVKSQMDKLRDYGNNAV